VDALTHPIHYPHPVGSVERLETHISHILLAGDYAYKIKKPLNLGFLDFTSLAQRKFYCNKELQLNRRLAPHLYLDCIPICGSVDHPVLGGNPAEAIEYAVKMRRFSQAALLDRRLAEGLLAPRHLDALARQLAGFHHTVARARSDMPFGSPARIARPVLENFAQIRRLLRNSTDLEKMSKLEHWTATVHERLTPVLAARKSNGFIRECHGDLHLGNIFLEDERITIFDCIEFNENFHWIDVMSDLAFLTMDLFHRSAAPLAWRVLNAYLESSGDYQGLAVLPYYQVYRAMVRAKVAAIRLNQEDLEPRERAEVEDECRAYLNLALSFSHRQPPFLLITHGVSGSGKSTITGRLLETLGAIRIRSDVERKRLFGLAPLDVSDSGIGQGLYTAEASARTYARLLRMAGEILDARYGVIVDATFLERDRRQRFRDLARDRNVPLVLLNCSAERDTLYARLADRRASGHDAAEADIRVLKHQLENYLPLGPEEAALDARDYTNDELLKRIRRQVIPRDGPNE
jgi:hypothetical protein